MGQWDGEGAKLYKPWLEGTLQPSDFLSPHTESRTLPSKVVALLLLVINDQWNGRVQMVANALICGVMAIGLCLASLRSFGGAHRVTILSLVGCYSALPDSWENTTWGFPIIVLLLVFFSLIEVWGLTLHDPLSIQWWAGSLAALLACVSMASGVVVLAAVLGFELLRIVTRRARGCACVANCWLLLCRHHPLPRDAGRIS